MRVTILGAGQVGTTLGAGFARASHEVIYASRDPESEKVRPLRDAGLDVRVTATAVAAADVVVLTTPGAAAKAAVEGAGDLGGRPLLDVTNPVAPGLGLTVGHTSSGAEVLQATAKNARVVKIFNTTGVENMAAPIYDGVRTFMPYCGDDDDAKRAAHALAFDIGFDPVDVGPLAKARLLEPFALVWITLAMQRGLGRDFAFALLRRGGAAARS